MSILAGRCALALLVSVSVVGCGSKDSDGTPPDYDGLRREDDTKHMAYPPEPAAGTNEGWTSLAPAAGPALNVGIVVPGEKVDAGDDASTRPDAGPDATVDAGRDATTISYDLAITNNLYVSGGTRPSPSLFSADSSATITRTGTGLFTLRTNNYTSLQFSWTSTNYNVIGYAIQFGSEAYVYTSNSGATGSASGTGSMLIEVYSSVCSQLPSTCFQTNMKLYAVTRLVEGGIEAGLSAPFTIPVAIDCNGCL
jgi:hypothetical protein